MNGTEKTDFRPYGQGFIPHLEVLSDFGHFIFKVGHFNEIDYLDFFVGMALVLILKYVA